MSATGVTGAMGTPPGDTSFSMAGELASDPRLQGAAIGDGALVLTPCARPPSRSELQRWLATRTKHKVSCGYEAGEDAAADDDVAGHRSRQVTTANQEFDGSVVSSLVEQDAPMVCDSPSVCVASRLNDSPAMASQCCRLPPGGAVASTPIRTASLSSEYVAGCTPIACVSSQEGAMDEEGGKREGGGRTGQGEERRRGRRGPRRSLMGGGPHAAVKVRRGWGHYTGRESALVGRVHW